MNKRARIDDSNKAVVNVWKREVGELSTRNFAHRLGALEDLVLRLDLYKKLERHKGCVNTVSFNAAGDILVSGSDDRRVILWNWETGRVKLSFQSGHNNNVFQAKIMPYTDDQSIVTCAADGQGSERSFTYTFPQFFNFGYESPSEINLGVKPICNAIRETTAFTPKVFKRDNHLGF